MMTIGYLSVLYEYNAGENKVVAIWVQLNLGSSSTTTPWAKTALT